MPIYTFTGLTGQGWRQINGGAFVGVTDYQLLLTSIATPKVRTLGTVRPYAVRYAGVVLLGASPSDDGTIYGVVAHQHIIRYEKEWVYMQINGPSNVGKLQCQDVGWRLATGVTLSLSIFDF